MNPWDLIDELRRERFEAQRRAYLAEAALARVEALCQPKPGHRQLADHHATLTVAEVRAALRGPQDERHEFDGVPGTTLFCRRDNGDGTFCHKHRDDPIHRGPQDEEATEVCGAHGCSNRATGMRKSHVPGWADVPDCGMHTQRSGTARPEAAVVCTDCGGTGIAYFETNCKGCSGLVSPAHDPTCGVEPCHCTQRSGTAPPDHPRDTCTDQCETDWHTAECAAGRTTQPEEDHDAR